MSEGRPRNPPCSNCGEGKLYHQRHRRFGSPLVMLGFLILAPAVWAATTGIYTFLGSVFMAPTMVSDGSELGFFAARAGIFRILIPGLLATGLGAWLVSKHAVMACNRCDEVLPGASGTER